MKISLFFWLTIAAIINVMYAYSFVPIKTICGTRTVNIYKWCSYSFDIHAQVKQVDELDKRDWSVEKQEKRWTQAEKKKKTTFGTGLHSHMYNVTIRE